MSQKATESKKLLWFDTIGCALGGSQQDDAKILLKHHQAMGGGNGKATSFVSGFKTNPVDASFINGHMIRAMDYQGVGSVAISCVPVECPSLPGRKMSCFACNTTARPSPRVKMLWIDYNWPLPVERGSFNGCDAFS